MTDKKNRPIIGFVIALLCVIVVLILVQKKNQVRYDLLKGPSTSVNENRKHNVTIQLSRATEQPLPQRNTKELVLSDKWLIVYGNAVEPIVSYRNLSGKPIKAFRVTWSALDDFEEVIFKNTTEFTSASIYYVNGEQTQGHVIQPEEVIYCKTMIIDGEDEHDTIFFGRDDLHNVTRLTESNKEKSKLNKKLVLNIDKIIFDN